MLLGYTRLQQIPQTYGIESFCKVINPAEGSTERVKVKHKWTWGLHYKIFYKQRVSQISFSVGDATENANKIITSLSHRYLI